MQPYIEINSHCIGKSHIENGLTCEDYSATYADDFLSVAVISDGHGDRNCFRSERGARYACEISINLCRQFQRITSSIQDIENCDFNKFVVSLESKIADHWKEKVLSDARIHPFTDDELLKISSQVQTDYINGKRIEKAYGCTLIVTMCVSNYWLCIQIGDGKCVAAYHDGIFVEPIPIDDNCLGNISTSLCNPNAKDLFRHYYSKIKPSAIFLSSDGVEESFNQMGLYNCFYSVAYWLKKYGKEITYVKLADLLPKISEGGSGDDTSLAAIVSLSDAIVAPRQTLNEIYEKVNVCTYILEQYSVSLENTKDKLSKNIAKKNNLEKEIADLKSIIEKKLIVFESVSKECKQIEEEIIELSTKIQQALEQKEKANKYKDVAEEYWHSEFDRLGITFQLNSKDIRCEEKIERLHHTDTKANEL